MAEALDSDKIARHAFEVGRRGYEQQEVRAFLHEVSSLVQRLEREIAEQRERAAHAEAQLDQAGAPDEAMLLERLGEETTRVLSSAREAAAEIRAKAEVEAERIVAHATLDAAEARAEAMRGADRRVVEAEAERESLLHDARTELDRRRAEAEELATRIRDEAAVEVAALHEGAHEEAARLRAEAEEAIDAARAQGRDMVAEAQAVRERVLHDLAVRRKKARRQVEKLNAGRERLLQAYDVVRRLIDEATDELGVSLIDARAAADAAGQRVEGEPDPSPEQLAEEMLALLDVDVDVDGDHDGEGGDEDEDEDGHDERDEDGAPLLVQSAAVSDPGRSPGGVASQSSEVTGPDPSVESRRRKGRRRKGGFVGLPEGARAPAGEGVTLLPATTDGDEPPTDERAPGSRGSDATEVGPDRSAGDEAADIAADLQRAHERVREAELAAERQRAADAAREAERQRAADAERAEAEARAAQAKEESERAEAQRADAERAAAAARAAKEESERAEAQRADAERAAAERAAAEARAAKEESERAEAQRAEAEAQAAEAARAEADRAAAQRAEVHRQAEVETAVRAEDPRPGSAADPEGETEPPTVTDLFARLRAETNGDATSPDVDAREPPAVEADRADEPETAAVGEPTAFTAREAVLGPIVKQLNRGLKRALADEQNEVLDRLRRAKPRGVDDLLPAADDHAARWAEVAAEALAEAAAAGASWSGGLAGSVADLADELARSLTAPLRDRIDRSFAASDGNLDDVADRVRALYREWKGQRLAETAQHHASAAYARGLYDALGVKVPVQWVVDPDGVPCPDCDDNVLGGSVPRGTEFPTGHDCAPAHPGCRCLVLATDG